MTPRSSSISVRLMWMNLLVSGTVLLLTILAFFIYDLISFRQNLIRNLESAARIVGANSVTAIMFDDPQSATTTLRALASSPDVDAALLVTADGRIFAEYRRPGRAALQPGRPLAAGIRNRYEVSGERVTLAHRILFEGKPTGTVYIAAKLTETGKRVVQYLIIAGVIFALGLVVAIAISSRARKTVARPMMALAETARRISRERDYSVRAAPVTGQAETEVLIEAFNEMLAEIHEQNTALSHARNELEEKVQHRTAALQAANREMEAFSYTVAHDLRSPLDMVLGSLYLLDRLGDEQWPIDRHRFIEQIRQSTCNMVELIDDLLNLSRATTVALKKEPVNLSGIVRRIAEDLRRSEPDRKVEFVIAQVPPMEADPGLLRVAVDNLIRNAWKYASKREDARIEFGVQQTGAETVYFVRDNGAGFDPNQSHKLFQPFQRLHSQIDYAGTGVGLATVQRIVVRHGGRIWAEGALEQGATFWFTLTGEAMATA